jgi:signal peptidase I
MAQKKSDGVFEIAKTVGYAVLIALVIRSVLYEPFRIPSGSMIPSLLVGDYLFVSKYSYGYSKYSFPFSLDLFSGRIMESAPKRGDVVVFRQPPHPEVDFIKRIIGLPGDHIQVKGGILYINDVAVIRDKIPDYVDEQGNSYTQYIETLPNGVKHHIIEMDGDQGSLDNTAVYVVPPDHYFAMGDNRDNSADSRVPEVVGYVPAENLVGKAQIIFFSTDGSAHWWEVWKWPFAMRFARFFDLIT